MGFRAHLYIQVRYYIYLVVRLSSAWGGYLPNLGEITHLSLKALLYLTK